MVADKLLVDWLYTNYQMCQSLLLPTFVLYGIRSIYLLTTYYPHIHTYYTVKAQNKNNELQTITGFPIGNVQQFCPTYVPNLNLLYHMLEKLLMDYALYCTQTVKQKII